MILRQDAFIIDNTCITHLNSMNPERLNTLLS
uniref:Transcriptional regulator n=1 Tax=Hymenolepis diminuta TaxID=6216 RepID=A0A0R3SFG1_HYMDI